MSRSPVRSLSDVRTDDRAHLVVVCHCKRETCFEVQDVAAYFDAMGWSDGWPDLAKRFRCAPGSPWGCGRKARRVILALGPPSLPFDRMPQLPAPARP
jgi:hypothetical protein